jgi:hypothetical protein
VVRATTSSTADSGGHIDLFRVLVCFEWANGGEDLRLEVDCSKMERNLKRMEAGSEESLGQ